MPLLFPAQPLKPEELKDHFSPYDLKRLHSYAQSMIDFHAIMDLLPLGACQRLAPRIFFVLFLFFPPCERALAAPLLMPLGARPFTVARLWFEHRLPVTLSPTQMAILLGLGLQCKVRCLLTCASIPARGLGMASTPFCLVPAT